MRNGHPNSINARSPERAMDTCAFLLPLTYIEVVSLDRKCLGASPRIQTLLRRLPRGIFDKGTRRKTVAVAGAARELGGRSGLY